MEDSVTLFLRRRRILQMETWIMRAILAEAFLIALWPAGATGALALGIVFWLRRLKIDPDFHFRHLPFDVPICLFVILGAVSVLVSPDKGFSFYNYYNLVGVYALTYLLVGQNIRSRSDVKRLVGALAASALAVVLYGFYQYLFGIDISEMRWVDGEAFPELRTRVFSTWENPNILAGYLDAAICVALGIYAKTTGRPRKMFLAGSMVLMALCLAMTYARGACFALMVILAGYGLCKDKRILIACAVGAAALLLSDTALYERLASVFTKVDTSSEMRWAIWESTVAMIEDHPFFGIGWGAFWMVYPSYDFYLQGADVKLVHAHNIYLNYAAEIGIAGALAFFWYFFGTLRLAFCFRDEKLEDERREAGERVEKKRLLETRIHDMRNLLNEKKDEAHRQHLAEEEQRKQAEAEREKQEKAEHEKQEEAEREKQEEAEREKQEAEETAVRAETAEMKDTEPPETAEKPAEEPAEEPAEQTESPEETETREAEQQEKTAEEKEKADGADEEKAQADTEDVTAAAEPDKTEETAGADTAGESAEPDKSEETVEPEEQVKTVDDAAGKTPPEKEAREEDREKDLSEEKPEEAPEEEAKPVETPEEDGKPEKTPEEAGEPAEVSEETEKPEEAPEETVEPTEVSEETVEPTEVSEETVEPTEVSEEAEKPEEAPEEAEKPEETTEEPKEVSEKTEEPKDTAEDEAAEKQENNAAEMMETAEFKKSAAPGTSEEKEDPDQPEKQKRDAKEKKRQKKEKQRKERAEKERRRKEQEEKERQEALAKQRVREIDKLEEELTAADKELEEMEKQERDSIPQPSLDYAAELKTWEPHTFCEGVNFGIGLAFISVALNGLTDDLLFNIPTSMLLWMMAALAVSIPEIPKEEPTGTGRFWMDRENNDAD